MADTHLQINSDGSTAVRKTTLWPSKKTEQEPILRSIFEQKNWIVTQIENVVGSHWKIETKCFNLLWKINLYISSIRDESRQPDEFKMQLGSSYPDSEEEGWINLVLGIYTIDDNTNPIEYILSGYAIDRYDFAANPSIRGTRTSGLQKAKILGLYQTEKSVLFRPEFIYYYIESQSAKKITNLKVDKTAIPPFPRQQIFYGAPGTGKSHTINCEVVEKERPHIRTTFHPDSDYSTFVGAYKPTSTSVRVTTLVGTKQVLVENAEPEKKIIYEFVPQAFLKAYTEAWKNQNEPFFLIIEEINRGNCAQIFGDLFQLLDRDDNGWSKYHISPDNDIKKFLQTDKIHGFAELDKELIDSIPDEIRFGEKMKLPPNLYIWATMNTSDQSLFPIDSAFKRRWDWKYIRINEGKDKDGTPLNYRIQFKTTDGNIVDVSWWEFVKSINKEIEDVIKSEDKKLGYFFCKPDKKAKDEDKTNTIISAETFVGKVVFYLWQDVFKDYGFKSDIFTIENNKKISFHDFYPDNITETEDNPEAIDFDLVKRFIDKVMNKTTSDTTDKTTEE